MPNFFGAMGGALKKGLQAPGKALMKTPGIKQMAKPINKAVGKVPGMGAVGGAMGMGQARPVPPTAQPTPGIGPSQLPMGFQPPPEKQMQQDMPPPIQGSTNTLDPSMFNPNMGQSMDQQTTGNPWQGMMQGGAQIGNMMMPQRFGNQMGGGGGLGNMLRKRLPQRGIGPSPQMNQPPNQMM